MRYQVETRSWDGSEYAVVVDTSADEENQIVCMEPLEFYAFQEGAFIETVNEDGRARMEQIAWLLNMYGGLSNER